MKRRNKEPEPESAGDALSRMGSFRFYRRVHIFPGLTVNFDCGSARDSRAGDDAGLTTTIGKRGKR
jgi:hypothetical protein